MPDLKFAVRQLLKEPGFTAVALLTLGLGIGANTAMFSVVNGVLLRPLAYDEPGQLVQVWEAPDPSKHNSVSPGVFLDWKQESTAFEGLAVLRGANRNLTDAGEPERLNGMSMSASGLRILRARPLLGRTFAPDEDQPGHDKVVVITERLWQRRFGGDRGIAGQSIHLDEESYTVIGVLPSDFLPWEKVDFVIPHVFESRYQGNRANHFLRVMGRLKPGTTVSQAQSDLVMASQRFRPLYPTWKRGWGVAVVPMHEELTGGVRPTLRHSWERWRWCC